MTHLKSLRPVPQWTPKLFARPSTRLAPQGRAQGNAGGRDRPGFLPARVACTRWKLAPSSSHMCDATGERTRRILIFFKIGHGITVEGQSLDPSPFLCTPRAGVAALFGSAIPPASVEGWALLATSTLLDFHSFLRAFSPLCVYKYYTHTCACAHTHTFPFFLAGLPLENCLFLFSLRH